MLAQIGLGAAAGALLAPFLLVAACAVLVFLAELAMLLLVAGVRAWNIHHDVAAPSFDRHPPAG